MLKIKKIAIILAVFLVFFSFYTVLVHGQTATSSSSLNPTPTPSFDKLNDLQKQINDLESKIAEAQNTEKSLSSQIAVMDNQMQLTELRINATKLQLSELTTYIKAASLKINNLEGSLTDITRVLIGRIVATYQTGSAQPLGVLLSSSDVTDFLSRANYLRIVQAHDKKMLYDMQQARNDYEKQKAIFEQKKKQVEALNTQLKDYTAQLDQEKKDKKVLLATTQSNESIYRQKLATARAEQAAISAIASGGGDTVPVGPVKAGDIVGYMISGRSPCSSGTHLHFEVHQNGALANPSNFLMNKDVIWDNSPDSSFSFTGSWPFPLADPIRIEQGFGSTYWARAGWYPNPPGHTGIDMYSSSSMAVRAVMPGTLYRGTIACGGGQLPYAKVAQDNGIEVLYLHIQP